MKHIYFPFGYIPEEKAEKIVDFFKSVALFLPSHGDIEPYIKKMSEAGMLDLRIDKKNSDNLSGLMKDYETWAKTHKGSELLFIATEHEGKAPFYADDTLISKLKSDIKKKLSEKKGKRKSDRLERAKLFLHMACKFDKQNSEIEQKILSCADMEKRLIGNIKGEQPDIASIIHDEKEDIGSFMTEQRIVAWAQLFLNDEELGKEKKMLFATDSRAIFDYLKGDDVGVAKDGKEIKKITESDLYGFFKECMVVEEAPVEFFAKIAVKEGVQTENSCNTIVALF